MGYEIIAIGPKANDHTGKTFGRLTVIGPVERVRYGNGTQIKWLCICECGTECTPRGGHLINGASNSCGCLHKELAAEANRVPKTHGMRYSPEYKVWQCMRQRIRQPNHTHYKSYGGRGLTIDPRWDDFALFYTDMGKRPGGYLPSGRPEYSIERRDNDLGYSKDNCYWATWKQQANNRRKRK